MRTQTAISGPEAGAAMPRMQLSLQAFIPYVLMHLACLGVFWTGVTWSDVALLAGTFFFRMFGVSVGYHRYFAHRSFKTSRPMQFVLALWGVIGMQRGPLWWADTHRAHHRHADTPRDLHSPLYQGFGYAHWGWIMDKRHLSTDLNRVKDLARFPELVWLNDWRVYIWPMALYGVFIYAVAGARGLVWGVALSTVLLFHLVHWIQSFSHRFGGYRRCPSRDNSRNHFLVGVLSLGEWHNNHHYYPSSAREGFVWWELDVGYYVLALMSRLGLVWDVRVPPRRVLEVAPPLAEAESPVHGASEAPAPAPLPGIVESRGRHDFT